MTTLAEQLASGSIAAQIPGDNSTGLASTAYVQTTVNGILNKDVSGGSNVTLTSNDVGHGILNFIGTLTANISVIVPNTSYKWTVANNTAGGFQIILQTAAPVATITLGPGVSTIVYCDGSNNIIQAAAATNNSLLYYFGSL
jgi:hypothetical protein